MNAQQTFTHRIRDEIEQRGLALRVEMPYANAGTLRVYIAGTLDDVCCRVRFSFQSRYATLEIDTPCSFELRDFHVDELDAAVAAVVQHLPPKLSSPRMRKRARR